MLVNNPISLEDRDEKIYVTADRNVRQNNKRKKYILVKVNVLETRVKTKND